MTHIAQSAKTPSTWLSPQFTPSEVDALRQSAEKNYYYIAWASNGGDDQTTAYELYLKLLAAGRDRIKANKAGQQIEAIAARLRHQEAEAAADYWVNMGKSEYCEV